MELKWLQDFVALADSGSFSKAAAGRNVTQSALSRRIRALERWLRVELVDRSTYPMSLTEAGNHFYGTAAQILQQIHYERSHLQAPQDIYQVADTVAFAAPHSLATYFFPQFLGRIEQTTGQLRVRLISENLHDSVETLIQGGCDLLIAFYVPQIPLLLSADRCQFHTIGEDRLVPVCAPDATGRPQFILSDVECVEAPLLAYEHNSYLGRAIQLLTAERGSWLQKVIYENALAEGLKSMALFGRGIAWLPENAIRQELREGKLVHAGDPSWELPVQIRLYRLLPPHSRRVEDVWKACCALSEPGNAISA